MTPRVNLEPCKHGQPVTIHRTENGWGDHWIIENDCCESAIHWSWSLLAHGWNHGRRQGADAASPLPTPSVRSLVDDSEDNA